MRELAQLAKNVKLGNYPINFETMYRNVSQIVNAKKVE